MAKDSFSIYEFHHYVKALSAWIDYRKNAFQEKGIQNALAKSAGVHSSYFSRVLAGNVHLVPDQAMELAHSQGWGARESEYFLNLVLLARAGSPRLRKQCEARLQELRDDAIDLDKNLSAKKINPGEGNPYYSDWYFPAVHLSLSMPGVHTAKSIASRLNLPLEQIESILQTLQTLGLSKKEGSQWKMLEQNIHLSNHSWLSAVQHKAWRMRTCQELSFKKESSVHYSGLHGLSRNDFEKIKAILKESLINVDRVVRPSKEEEICHLGIDWYRL